MDTAGTNDTAIKAILFGLVTAAFIAKKLGWTFDEFVDATVLSWRYEKR